MKSTGVVRRLDNLGRVVLPIELRRTMGIDVKDKLEVLVDGENIVLRRYHDACIFCGGDESLIFFNGKQVCRDLAEGLAAELR